jgi:hypothetical protein
VKRVSRQVRKLTMILLGKYDKAMRSRKRGKHIPRSWDISIEIHL